MLLMQSTPVCGVEFTKRTGTVSDDSNHVYITKLFMINLVNNCLTIFRWDMSVSNETTPVSTCVH